MADEDRMAAVGWGRGEAGGVKVERNQFDLACMGGIIIVTGE